MARPLRELHPSDDRAAHDVHGDELRVPGVADERVPSVAGGGRIARLAEALDLMQLEHGHAAGDRVRDERVRADAFDAERRRRGRDPPVDVAGRHSDEHDMRLGVGGHVRERLVREHGRREREREQELTPVHVSLYG